MRGRKKSLHPRALSPELALLKPLTVSLPVRNSWRLLGNCCQTGDAGAHTPRVDGEMPDTLLAGGTVSRGRLREKSRTVSRGTARRRIPATPRFSSYL
jgi:hypothetical protein